MRLKEKLHRKALLADWLENTNTVKNWALFGQMREELARQLTTLAYGDYDDPKSVLDVKPKRGERHGTYNSKCANGDDSLPIREKQDYLLFVAQVLTKVTAPEDKLRGEEAERWLITALRMIAQGADVELALNIKARPTEHKSRSDFIDRENAKNSMFGMIHTLNTDVNTYVLIEGKLAPAGEEPTISIDKAIAHISLSTSGYTEDTLAAYWKREKARKDAIRAADGKFKLIA